jgi:hypothetical protein
VAPQRAAVAEGSAGSSSKSLASLARCVAFFFDRFNCFFLISVDPKRIPRQAFERQEALLESSSSKSSWTEMSPVKDRAACCQGANVRRADSSRNLGGGRIL